MASLPLITPPDCAVGLVDYKADLAFAAGSADRQGIRSAALALAKTAVVATGRRTLIFAGFLTEACVSFPGALRAGGGLSCEWSQGANLDRKGSRKGGSLLRSRAKSHGCAIAPKPMSSDHEV
jgi:hypothetical protein